MSPQDLRVLADRATRVEGRPATRLAEVHARIDTTRRRRQLGAVVATVVAVVLALSAGTAVVRMTESAPPPAKPPVAPTPTPQVDDDVSSGGLVYARGSTIHLGDRTIDAGDEVAGVAATAEGAVFTRASAHENCNQPGGCYAPLLFTDGSEILRIGRVAGTWVRGYQIEVSSAGSTLVWFEPSPDSNAGENYVERGQYIAYDTAARREVARFGSADADIKEVYDGSVYWTPDDHTRCLDYSKYNAACLRFSAITRLDTSTGTQTEVPWASYTADRNSRPSTFVLPIKGDPDTPGPVYDETPDFGRSGDRLVGDDGGNAVLMHLASNGEPVRLHLPTGYDEDAQLFFFHRWLGDGRFSLVADNTDDILVCQLSSGRCRVVVKGPLDYGFGGHG